MKKPKVWLIVLLAGSTLLGGCDTLRLAPSELQKQNTYLHHKTVQTAAIQAKEEQTSPTLQELTEQATDQAEAIVAYYGLPDKLPAADSTEAILSSENKTLAKQARLQAVMRPDPWDVTDNLLELGIGIAGIFGGVFGTRMLRHLQSARQKSTALREIVRGNELFKQDHPKVKTAFKKAHQLQSPQTKQMVVEMKS